MVGVQRGEFRGELLTLAGVDGDGFVGEAGFLKEKGNLHWIGREAVKEFNHGTLRVGERG